MAQLAALIADTVNRASVAGTTSRAARCRLATIRTSLDDADRDALDELLGARRAGQPIYSDEVVLRILDRGGHPISASTIRRHRTAICACFRTAA